MRRKLQRLLVSSIGLAAILLAGRTSSAQAATRATMCYQLACASDCGMCAAVCFATGCEVDTCSGGGGGVCEGQYVCGCGGAS